MAEVCVRISFVILKSLIAFEMGLSIVALSFSLLVSASRNAARSAEKVWRIGYFGGAKRVNPAFSQAFAAMARAGADALIMVVDRLVAVHRRRLSVLPPSRTCRPCAGARQWRATAAS